MDTHKDSCACVVQDVRLVAWYSQLPIKGPQYYSWLGSVRMSGSSVLYSRNIFIYIYIYINKYIYIFVKVKQSRYRPGMAQKVPGS